MVMSNKCGYGGLRVWKLSAISRDASCGQLCARASVVPSCTARRAQFLANEVRGEMTEASRLPPALYKPAALMFACCRPLYILPLLLSWPLLTTVARHLFCPASLRSLPCALQSRYWRDGSESLTAFGSPAGASRCLVRTAPAPPGAPPQTSTAEVPLTTIAPHTPKGM
jgi:hypothetical protein